MTLSLSGVYYLGCTTTIVIISSLLVVVTSATQVCLNKVVPSPHLVDLFFAPLALPPL
jgi:hypothetical protein